VFPVAFVGAWFLADGTDGKTPYGTMEKKDRQAVSPGDDPPDLALAPERLVYISRFLLIFREGFSDG